MGTETLQAAKRRTTQPSAKPRQISVAAKTLRGYLKAAILWINLKAAPTPKLDMVDPLTGQLHPTFETIIRDRQTWQQPKDKREPIPLAIHETLKAQVVLDIKRYGARTTLATTAAVFDWLRLGCFTGSRVGEYAQSHSKLHTYAQVPNNTDAGEWAGTPLAFRADDFTFYTATLTTIPHEELWTNAPSVTFVHIRFRYDKSKNNFTVRKFKYSGHPILCPVSAAISILLRARQLDVPPNKPLGVYSYSDHKQPLRRYTYLRSSDIIRLMRRACKEAFPPEHFLHQNVHLLVAHSTRVTAAVALYNSGLSIAAIAYRLRWSEPSVTHYIREATTQIGSLTEDAIAGATLL